MSRQIEGVPVLNERHYLGDGLYVSFDGWHLILTAPRDEGGEHYVGLEPGVWRSLRNYLAKYPRLAQHLGEKL